MSWLFWWLVSGVMENATHNVNTTHILVVSSVAARCNYGISWSPVTTLVFFVPPHHVIVSVRLITIVIRCINNSSITPVSLSLLVLPWQVLLIAPSFLLVRPNHVTVPLAAPIINIRHFIVRNNNNTWHIPSPSMPENTRLPEANNSILLLTAAVH
jgi:hypothetical protein